LGIANREQRKEVVTNRVSACFKFRRATQDLKRCKRAALWRAQTPFQKIQSALVAARNHFLNSAFWPGERILKAMSRGLSTRGRYRRKSFSLKDLQR
jgi:hypothetical protein